MSTFGSMERIPHDRKILIIDNKIYDVTEFHHEHPGGSQVLLTHIGKDASDVFHAMHPESAFETLANHYIGDNLDSIRKGDDAVLPNKKKRFTNDIRQLRDRLADEGYFQANGLYYIYKFISTLALCFVSLLILCYYGQQSTMAIVLSAFLLGLFWQQCGWLSHDFGHHQVFQHREWNDLAVIFLGNFCQGFALSWWKNKHNTHHASTNVNGHDPDIDTAPVLLWDEYASANFYGALSYTGNNTTTTNMDATSVSKDDKNELGPGVIDRFMAENVLPYQTRYYFFVLAFARASWATQSLLHLATEGALNKTTALRCYELVCLVLHWLLFISATARWIDGLHNQLLFFVLSQSFTGYMLAMVFALNHNGMPVMTQEQAETMEFFEIQVITSRNVKAGPIGTWFMGGLNYQIEHHVFPTLPRHHLATVQPMVEAICRKHQISYHTTSFIQGTLESLDALDVAQKVSRKLVKKSS
ncbi:unnamed protein product [Absidia cylindrospora]